MDRLTKEQIEAIRQHWCDVPAELKDHPAVKKYNLVCDMALQFLSQESVRSEARPGVAEIEAARIALHAAIAMNEGFSDKWYEERWGYVDLLCNAALQSPARVAEGKDVHSTELRK